MNGAQRLIQTLVENGVSLVVGNPGTSEMQFVHALDSSPGVRGVLALFEGVATGAADGYGRMADPSTREGSTAVASACSSPALTPVAGLTGLRTASKKRSARHIGADSRCRLRRRVT